MSLSVGRYLRQIRLKKKISLAAIARQTKIPLKTLQALEANRFDQLPPPTFIKGFIKKYLQVLDVSPQRALALFRRDYAFHQKTQILPSGLVHPPATSSWTPKKTFFLGLFLFLLLLTSYLYLQFRSFSQPPPLTVLQPEENQLVTRKTVVLKGKTDPDATLQVNGQTLTLQPDGSFQQEYVLSLGEEVLVFTATSRRGKTTTVTRHLRLAPEIFD